MYLKRVLSFGIISLFFYGCATSTNSYNHKIDPKQLSAQILSGERGPYAIQYIKNPSEKVQLAAVEKNARAIQYIKNPTEKVQLVAVKKDPYVIGYIKNPSEKVQLAAVKKDPLVIILHIKNPTEKVQLAAVKLNKKAIERIKHPTKIVELVAYGQTKVYMPKLDFVLENNDIIIKVKNQKLTVTNKTWGGYYEFGVYKGDSFRESYRIYQQYVKWMKSEANSPEKWRQEIDWKWDNHFYGFDTFKGMPNNDEGNQNFSKGTFLSSLDEVKRMGEKVGMFEKSGNVKYFQGTFDSIAQNNSADIERLQPAAVVNIDGDLYLSAVDALNIV
jgi:hypothetical protein